MLLDQEQRAFYQHEISDYLDSIGQADSNIQLVDRLIGIQDEWMAGLVSDTLRRWGLLLNMTPKADYV